MARRKSNRLGWLTLIIIGLIVYLWYLKPTYGIAALVVGVVLILAAFWPKTCQICGNQIRRVSYTWTIEGQKKRVCPKCNQALERRQSKQVFDDLFDKK
ncbi:MAG: hypothetical protein NTX52_14310 [Planctomycetota bacterium]|nr:hypothetical protein [Planctomycetota bacterium]